MGISCGSSSMCFDSGWWTSTSLAPPGSVETLTGVLMMLTLVPGVTLRSVGGGLFAEAFHRRSERDGHQLRIIVNVL